MLYVFIGLVLAVLALGGVASCEHQKVNELEAKIEANKIEADRVLQNAKVQGQLDAADSEKGFKDAIKTLTDANRYYAGQLRDPGRRNGCPATTGSVAGVPQDATTGSELSDEAGKFLRSEADRADIAATYAEECRKHATKPTIRSQLESMKGKP